LIGDIPTRYAISWDVHGVVAELERRAVFVQVKYGGCVCWSAQIADLALGAQPPATRHVISVDGSACRESRVILENYRCALKIN